MATNGVEEDLDGDALDGNALDDDALEALLVALEGGEERGDVDGKAEKAEEDGAPVDLPDVMWDCLGDVLEAAAERDQGRRTQTAERVVRCIETRGSPREIVMMATAIASQEKPKSQPARLRLQRALERACARERLDATPKRLRKMLADCAWIFERYFSAPLQEPEIQTEALHALVRTVSRFAAREDLRVFVCALASRALGSCASAPPCIFASKAAQDVVDLLANSQVANTLDDLHRMIVRQQQGQQDEEGEEDHQGDADGDKSSKDEAVDYFDERALACVAVAVAANDRASWVPSVWTTAEKIRIVDPLARHLLSIRASQFAAERGVQLAAWALRGGDKGSLAGLGEGGMHERALKDLGVALANYASSHPVAARRADAVQCLIRIFDLVCGPAESGTSGGFSVLRGVYERCLFVPPRALAVDHVRRHVASTWDDAVCGLVAEFAVAQLEEFANAGVAGALEQRADMTVSVVVLTRLLAARGHLRGDAHARAADACKQLAKALQDAQAQEATRQDTDSASAPRSNQGHGLDHGQNCGAGAAQRAGSAAPEDTNAQADAPFHPPPPPAPDPLRRALQLALLEDAVGLAISTLT